MSIIIPPITHRPYESEPLAIEAAGKISGDFLVDYISVIKYALDKCHNEKNCRKIFNMPPEPYSIDPEVMTNKNDLIVHAIQMLKLGGESWQWLYDNLSDNQSKYMLLTILAYRSIGWRYVKLPLNNKKFWDCLAVIGRSIFHNPRKLVTQNNIELTEANLESFGYNINLLTDTFGIFNEFIYSQYVYRGDTVHQYSPETGDYVIDCGACFGGTSLYFAECVGNEGKVFSFEFIEDNIDVFSENLSRNPHLNQRITLMKHPVWHQSGQELFVSGTGPGARVHTNDKVGGKKVITLSIDDLVKQQGLNRVNMIKMDIEGAEIEALRGATETITKFRPKLAISVYHKLTDFYEVPQVIKRMNNDYKFFIQHSTVHGDETVVFAI